MSDRYIQSKYSKEARVWEVRNCPYNQSNPPNNDWCVECPEDPKGQARLHWLPKSEYVEVPAPERWEDVTEQCVIDDYENRVGAFWSIIHTTVGGETGWNVMSKLNEGYRLKKVDQQGSGVLPNHAFIVERKVNP